MVRFRERFPPPWFYEEHHDRIVVRGAYGVKLRTIHVEPIEHPGNRGHKFPQVTRDYARSLALAVIDMANATS